MPSSAGSASARPAEDVVSTGRGNPIDPDESEGQMSAHHRRGAVNGRRHSLGVVAAAMALFGALAVLPAAASSTRGVTANAATDCSDPRVRVPSALGWRRCGDVPLLGGPRVMAPASTHAETCETVPGFNDRCPSWAATPYNKPEGVTGLDEVPIGNFGLLQPETVMSNDGKTAFAAIEASDGTYFCPILNTTVAGTDTVLLAYDTSSGAIRWSSVRGAKGSQAEFEVAAAALVPRVNLVVVVGLAAEPCGAPQALAIGFDATTGSQRWMYQLDDQVATASTAVAVAPSPDGRRVYVAGGYNPRQKPEVAESFVAALNPANGSQIWRHDDGTSAWSLSAALTVAPNGDVVLGENLHEQDAHGLLLTTGQRIEDLAPTNGVVRWSSTSPTGNLSALEDVATSGNAIYSVRCDIDNRRSDFQVVTERVSQASGEQTWSRSFGGNQGTACTGSGGTLAVSPTNGSLYVSGVDNTGMFLLAYDLGTGAVRFESGVDQSIGGTFAEAPAQGALVALSPDGSQAYLLSQNFSGGTCDECAGGMPLTLAAFNAATGAHSWVARYGEPAINEGAGLLVDSRTGRITVVGNEVQCSAGPVGATRRFAVVAVAFDPTPGSDTPPTPTLADATSNETVACPASAAPSVSGGAPGPQLPEGAPIWLATSAALAVAASRWRTRGIVGLHRSRPSV